MIRLAPNETAIFAARALIVAIWAAHVAVAGCGGLGSRAAEADASPISASQDDLDGGATGAFDVDAKGPSADCVPPCAAGLSCCGGACVDSASDESNCGGCGIVCARTASCFPNCGGKLTCCSGACVDVTNDPRNCGGCGIACPHDAASCAGSCRVPACEPVPAFHGPCSSDETCCGILCCAPGQICCYGQWPSGVACQDVTALSSCPPATNYYPP